MESESNGTVAKNLRQPAFKDRGTRQRNRTVSFEEFEAWTKGATESVTQTEPVPTDVTPSDTSGLASWCGVG